MRCVNDTRNRDSVFSCNESSSVEVEMQESLDLDSLALILHFALVTKIVSIPIPEVGQCINYSGLTCCLSILVRLRRRPRIRAFEYST